MSVDKTINKLVISLRDTIGSRDDSTQLCTAPAINARNSEQRPADPKTNSKESSQNGGGAQKIFFSFIRISKQVKYPKGPKYVKTIKSNLQYNSPVTLLSRDHCQTHLTSNSGNLNSDVIVLTERHAGVECRALAQRDFHPKKRRTPRYPGGTFPQGRFIRSSSRIWGGGRWTADKLKETGQTRTAKRFRYS